MRGASMVRLL